MVSAYSATGTGEFLVFTCCDFSRMKAEAAISVKVQKTQYRMTQRTRGRKSRGGLIVANSTLPQCELFEERSLEHDHLKIMAWL